MVRCAKANRAILPLGEGKANVHVLFANEVFGKFSRPNSQDGGGCFTLSPVAP
jgi:hypothetical protein